MNSAAPSASGRSQHTLIDFSPENSKNSKEMAKINKNLCSKIPLTNLSYGTPFQDISVGSESLASLAVKYHCSVN